MMILGLTGSIGMGKSTTANLFRQEGVPVFDADATVHHLQQDEALSTIVAAFPDFYEQNDLSKLAFDRTKFSKFITSNPEALTKMQDIIHPMVRQKRAEFLAHQNERKAPLVLLDIPLLFETRSDEECDFSIVVTTPFEAQKKRVLARSSMTEEKFNYILSRQMPDAEKRTKADFLIFTDKGIENARLRVQQIIEKLKSDMAG